MTETPYWSSRARVLLAEDDSEFRGLLATALRQDGLEVLEAPDGDALLDQVAGSLWPGGEVAGFDVLVADICLPGFSALDVLTGARRALRRTPVILMTAFGDPHTRDKALHLGAAAFFEKPFRIDDLRAAVQRSIRESLLSSQ